MLDDTIIAVSTPLGYGGLGVVRMTGPRSLQIAKKIFKPKNKRIPITANRPILGHLYEFAIEEPFEEALLTFFPKPHTYTREDTVEISCHGSPVILEEVVRQGIKAGARHASPGEFTLRAYVNGRIDIIQAEAINDIIMASSLEQAKISFRQLEGSLSKKAISLRQHIIQLLSQIEAAIEFPDEGISIPPKRIKSTLQRAKKTVQELISSYDLGKTLAEGLSLSITGRANVGKSTLFNTLLKEERAIVTPFPGTTRDYLQETFKIKGALFTLADMAGIGKPKHPVEKEGIERGKKLASAGDGVLVVLDASRKVSREDLEILKKFQHKKAIIIFNKIDLPLEMDLERIRRSHKNIPSLTISALNKINIDKLKDMIFTQFVPTQTKDKEIILHLRQKILLEDILDSLDTAKQMLEEGYSEEIYAEEIRKIVPLIGQLTGEIRDVDILDRIFSQFCIGK